MKCSMVSFGKTNITTLSKIELKVFTVQLIVKKIKYYIY